jgi:hypothetical protein
MPPKQTNAIRNSFSRKSPPLARPSPLQEFRQPLAKAAAGLRYSMVVAVSIHTGLNPSASKT